MNEIGTVRVDDVGIPAWNRRCDQCLYYTDPPSIRNETRTAYVTCSINPMHRSPVACSQFETVYPAELDDPEFEEELIRYFAEAEAEPLLKPLTIKNLRGFSKEQTISIYSVAEPYRSRLLGEAAIQFVLHFPHLLNGNYAFAV